MNKTLSSAIMAAMFFSEAMAQAEDFTVSIAGQQQSSRQYAPEGLPLVYCPTPADGQTNSLVANGSMAHSFFVIVQNLQPKTDTITMAMSDWYDCLQFTITESSGKTRAISRTEVPWNFNGLETWTFPINGMRIIAVDFTGHTMIGQPTDWQGVPPAPLHPELVTMTATFRYYDATKKEVSVTSKPTEVYLWP
jgi:hypothetical protein